MGMFDVYLPAGPPCCPIDGTPMVSWQGKEGPNLLLVWQEGFKHPVAHAVSDEVRFSAAKLESFTLPEMFHIYSVDCPHHFFATCKTHDGVWTSTEIHVPGM